MTYILVPPGEEQPPLVVRLAEAALRKLDQERDEANWKDAYDQVRYFLGEHGTRIRSTINHEIYHYNGYEFDISWHSPQASKNEPGGWYVFSTPEQL